MTQLIRNSKETDQLRLQNEELRRNNRVQPQSRIVKESPLQRKLFDEEDKFAQTISYHAENSNSANYDGG